MFFLLAWMIYGLIVGCITKFLYSGEEPTGWIPTLSIGIAGSYTGGFIYYLLSMNLNSFKPAGFLLSVLGGVFFLYMWQIYKKNVK